MSALDWAVEQVDSYSFSDDARAELAQLRQDRAELLEALKTAMPILDHTKPSWKGNWRVHPDEIARYRALIARMEAE